MMRFTFCFIVLFQFGYAQLFAQETWVLFKDKKGSSFNPFDYFEAQAIERRIREGLLLSDSSDFPLNQDYVQIVESLSNGVEGCSRWLNAVACFASEDQLKQISKLPFVKEIIPMTSYSAYCELDLDGEMDINRDSLLVAQTERLHNSLLRERGYTGKGVRIAVFDGGFSDVPSDSVFSHLVSGNHIKATYDFIKDKKYVFGFFDHGTEVLSCIAGISNGVPMGCATDADFLLARTEQVVSKTVMTEKNWIESLEWADKWGAEVVNSSLIYARLLYFRNQMDGQTSMITQAADMAFKKGILIVNSAGNDADNSWEIIGAPADGDSVLTVGGIDPWTGYHSYFSSYGPTADGRMKPNLCAFGYAMASTGTHLDLVSGTSFASPMVAGFAACIRQMHPEWTTHQLFEELQKSGELYPYFDYAHGYGVPQADYFVDRRLTIAEPTIRFQYEPSSECFEFIRLDHDSTLHAEDAPVEITSLNIQRSLSQPADLAYLQLCESDGTVIRYKVFSPSDTIAAFIDHPHRSDLVVRVFYRGYYLEVNTGIDDEN